MKNLLTSFLILSIATLFSTQIYGQTATYNYTGSPETFIVPDAVYSIMVTIQGGEGGTGNMGASFAAGGLGTEVSATLPVTPGDQLTFIVGQNGSNGLYLNTGGGGGGGSFVVGPVGELLLAAGGGGGGGCAGSCIAGSDGTGFGGTGAGGTGSDGAGGAGFTGDGSPGGGGSTGGLNYANGFSGGSPGGGSNGIGGYGGGGGGYFFGGGGGGYSGGNGAVFLGSAGGGTSFAAATAIDPVATPGLNVGAGQIEITYAAAVPTLSQWGLIILSLSILIFAFVGIKQRNLIFKIH